jgi:hypothetical protein
LIAPRLQLRFDPAKADGIDDAKIERLLQRLAYGMFTDGMIRR